MKPEQERVSTLLLDTITLLCRNGLTFQNKLTVQGVIGITVDDSDVFIVHINENLTENESSFERESVHSQPLVVSPVTVSANTPIENTIVARPRATKVRKKPAAIETNQLRYDETALPGPHQKTEIIDLDLEEDCLTQNTFTSNIARNLTDSDGFQYQQNVAVNDANYGKEEYGEEEQRTDDATYLNICPKREPEFDSYATDNYTSFTGRNEHMDGYEGAGVLDYQQTGETYAEEEQDMADVKPDIDQPPSFLPWDQSYDQGVSTYGQQLLPTRRISATGFKMSSRKLKSISVSNRFAMRGFAHVGQRYPIYRPTSSMQPRATATLDASDADGSIKTRTTYICNIDGCTSAFTLKSNLLRHQTNKHGRAKKLRKATSPSDLLYEQYGYEDEDN